MTNLPTIGRRAFLGAGVAVVAGSGLLATLSSRGAGRARFDRTDAFPDAVSVVSVELPGAPEGARGVATMFISTPRQVLSVALGEVTLSRGQAAFEVTLAYPFEERVAGDYSYHVRVRAGRHRAVTTEPARYSLRRIHWFS